jgi:hypothetical protein
MVLNASALGVREFGDPAKGGRAADPAIARFRLRMGYCRRTSPLPPIV